MAPLCVFPPPPQIITCILAFILSAQLLCLCVQVVITVDGAEIFIVGKMGSRLLTWASTTHVHSFPTLVSNVAYQTAEVCLPNLSLIFVYHTLEMIQTADKVYRNLYHKIATGSHFSMQFYDSYHKDIL